MSTLLYSCWGQSRQAIFKGTENDHATLYYFYGICTSGIGVKGRNQVHSMANKELKRMLHLGALTTIKNYPLIQTVLRKKKSSGETQHEHC